ncbi:PREDICTED: MAM and LDL-receptor class A domain-containing protein 1-like [Branchiostoma belcheri]|uniref:MAM and LDL-receptor class A domain-containing protein 1-like n=1 Tax=Branchiostoma belcheri TaxID=7741 RepID=A0A6P5AF16_BRABE|nr:PREDICTED: MAM and LDL-receptor class A domain-containing protein 1-like [Branchiostoma belcheri]
MMTITRMLSLQGACLFLLIRATSSTAVESCDFESYRICGYTQDRTDDFDWTRRRGSTTTSGTGPTGDHTTGSGYYMHIDGTGQSLGKKARLKSSLIFTRGAQDFCLEFYYHMYGSTVGTLNVYRDRSYSSYRVWSMSGNQGNAWQKASVDFSSSSSYFQIIFEGVRGQWDNSDIAIDDVEISNHACGAVPTGTGDCNFESSDICGYTHDRTHDFDWQRHRGATSSSGTGPSQDHTTGTGYYMYMETTLPATGDKARLVSPAIVGGGGKCVQFWYHMYGSRTGTLAVFNKVYDQTTQGTRVWLLSGNQGDAWRRARVTLSQTAAYFQLVFEGTNGGFFSDIAVDDIDVSDGSCRDVNECLQDAQACSPHAQCTNTADGYECTCRPGYSGNGHLCEGMEASTPVSVSTVSGLSTQQTLVVVGSVLGTMLVGLSAALIFTVMRNRQKSHDLRSIIEQNGEVAMDDISDEKLGGFQNPSYGILQVTIRNDVSDI